MKVELTSTGGKQSAIQGLPTLIPPHALRCLAATMKRGSKYGINNWHKIPVRAMEAKEQISAACQVDCGELDHMLQHYIGFRVSDNYDEKMEELAHMAARAAMALDQFCREYPNVYEDFIENESEVNNA